MNGLRDGGGRLCFIGRPHVASMALSMVLRCIRPDQVEYEDCTSACKTGSMAESATGQNPSSMMTHHAGLTDSLPQVRRPTPCARGWPLGSLQTPALRELTAHSETTGAAEADYTTDRRSDAA